MLRKFGWALSTLFLAACVTINIYFPAAEAEEAARTIVRDVLEEAVPDAAPMETPVPQEGQPQSGSDARYRFLWIAGMLMEVSVGTVQAADADINIDTPAINSLRASLGKRAAALASYYRSGAVGFDLNGGVTLRDPAAVPLKDRNQVKKLVADENQDRNALYREVARANGHPEWEADIRKTFARVWVQEAKPGFWYQKPDGSWARK